MKSTFVALHEAEKHKGEKVTETLPNNFSWLITLPTDSITLKKKKRNITPVGNQYLCGSCWSTTASEIVADNFVVSNKVNHPIQLSITYSLICYPQGQCNGGDPVVLFKDISHRGLVSTHCVNYDWCSQNPKCNGKATEHFDHKELNSKLPKGCGCIKEGVYRKYYIKKNIIALHDLSDQNNQEKIAKKHIRKFGPVLGSFLVYENFRPGVFTYCKDTEGVYFEKGSYFKNGTVQYNFPINPRTYAGSHAVSIVGWGITENEILCPDGQICRVKYWHCRNSRGEHWGDKGLFKIAMYPHNKMSQFEKNKTTNGHIAGGMVLIFSKKIVKEKIGKLSQTEIQNTSVFGSDVQGLEKFPYGIFLIYFFILFGMMVLFYK